MQSRSCTLLHSLVYYSTLRFEQQLMQNSTQQPAAFRIRTTVMTAVEERIADLCFLLLGRRVLVAHFG